MKIESAKTDLIKNDHRHDHRGGQGDQPCPPQHVTAQRGKLVGALDCQHRKIGIMPRQGGQQSGAFDGTGQLDDDVEHQSGRPRDGVKDFLSISAGPD
jgi:hypothetical protein